MSMNEQSLIFLHLFLTPGIGPGVIAHLMAAVPNDFSWPQLYYWLPSDFRQLGFSEKTAQLFYEGLSDRTILEKELALIERHKISWTTINDAEYPEALKNIHLPPTVLYWRGAPFPAFAQSVAVIGSREANEYGHRMINRLVPALVAHDFTIVSGGAIGADSMAHHAAVKAGGKTVVVIGEGLAQSYPSRSRELFDRVLAAQGSIVSIFPLELAAQPGNFPARNRVISGLSRGCVVIQAAAESGARITAQFALEQGRSVFAVPGSLDDPLSAGCHALILEGAKLIRSVDDILEDFGIRKVTEPVPQQKVVKVQAVKNMTIPAVADPLHQKILTICARPSSCDDLMLATNLPLEKLQEELFTLQLEGYVQQDHAGMWEVSS